MIVLDTNVVSYIFNERELADYYVERIGDQQTVISFQTLEELWFGAYKNRWGDRRRSRLALYIEKYKVIWPNGELVRSCADLRAERERAGRTLSTADAWIAATALLLDCPLACHDRDFSGIPNLRLIQAPTR